MPTAAKPAEELKAYERRFIDEAWNRGEYGIIEETVHADYVGHWFDPQGGDVDRDSLEAFVRDVREGFSDFHMDVEFMIAEDDTVMVAFTVEGTHDGEFMGSPPTGQSGTTPGIFVHRFDEDGMVVEAWAVWDALGLLQQVGVVPESFTLAAFLETGANLAKQDILEITKAKAN